MMAGAGPVAVFVIVPNRLLNMLPEPVDEIPNPVIVTLTGASEVAVKAATRLFRIICPGDVVELNRPIMADPRGLSVAGEGPAFCEVVDKNWIRFPDTKVG